MKFIIKAITVAIVSFNIFAGPGKGGLSGGTSTRIHQELERYKYEEQREVIVDERTATAAARKREVFLSNNLIEVNINDLEEVTLKDGSVVKSYELLEFFKK